MQASKATSSIRRLFASLNIHNNNCLIINTEVQKQNEAEIKKLQTKVVDLMIFGIHCRTYFTKTSRLFKFSTKASYEKT